MRLSTMTNIFMNRIESEFNIDYLESIRRCKEAGFKVLDLFLINLGDSKSRLNKDDWQQYAYKIKNEATKLGIEISQSHIPFKSGRAHIWKNEEEKVYFDKITKRAIEITSLVGGKNTVVHPVTEYIKTEHDSEASIKLNHEVFKDTIEYAFSNNVNISFENMPEFGSKRRFAYSYNELIELVDSFNDKRIGICWDLGHGNMSCDNQTIALKAIGKRLKMTHVHDNHGKRDDEHLLPYLGTINWEIIMKTLKEIRYNGDFTLEVVTNNKFPDVLKDKTARLFYEVGMHLLSLAE